MSDKTKRELPVAFIAYDLLESEGRDLARCAAACAPRSARASRRAPIREAKARGERLPIRMSPTVSADTLGGLQEKREQARALLREGLMLKAREAPMASGAARAATAGSSGGNGSSTRWASTPW